MPSQTAGPTPAVPVRISAAGTATHTLTAGTYRAFQCTAETGASVVKVTIGGVEFTFVAGQSWNLSSPDGRPLDTTILFTCTVGAFALSCIQ